MIEVSGSNVPDWIGGLPTGWRVVPLWSLTEMMTEKGTPVDGDVKISPENVEGSTGRVTDLSSGYSGDGWIFRKGDVLFNKLRTYLNKVVRCQWDGYSMGEMVVLRPSEGIDSSFLFYTMINGGHVRFLDSHSTGVKQPRTDPHHILRSKVPLPPLPEQREIVSFLDEKTSLIDEIIEKKTKRIELLKELRSSLISEVVTKGLDPDVEMKDSGVVWVGRIPSHWGVSKYKYISRVVTGNTPSKSNEDFYSLDGTGFPWVKPSDLDVRGDVLESEERLTDLGFTESRPVPRSSVLLCCIGNTIGKYGISGCEVSTNQQINSIVPDFDLVSSRYMYYLTHVFSQDIIEWSNFVTLPILTKTELENEDVIVPPLEEQVEMVKFLDQETRTLDSQMDHEERSITLLQELRQSLISEVVTGKIDVRKERGDEVH